MATQARAIATRKGIVDAAASVFVRHGYAGASISEIADEAGITKGAVYFHFRSKELLARAVVDAQDELATQVRERSVAGSPSAVAMLVAMVRELGVLMRDDVVARASMRLAVEVPTGELEDVGGTYEAWIGPTEHVIGQAVAEGDLRAGLDAAALARFLVAAFTGMQTVSVATSQLEDLMPRLREMWAIVLPGIVAPGREHIIPGLLRRA
ncbi:ScbR family autoregulator-binding transcription factor [Xylanimonas protaetiae]|uniref:ScbR family autoregulator-binding transcription factor n=1 Tax=Xylanimonas protaetiae TaxID=2509457 RepID=UPI0013EC4D09|nr:ScbR family autoregulator-binding transcription factor [Xylanimonas protaetiae]